MTANTATTATAHKPITVQECWFNQLPLSPWIGEDGIAASTDPLSLRDIMTGISAITVLAAVKSKEA
jgi:hypothetical protein